MTMPPLRYYDLTYWAPAFAGVPFRTPASGPILPPP